MPTSPCFLVVNIVLRDFRFAISGLCLHERGAEHVFKMVFWCRFFSECLVCLKYYLWNGYVFPGFSNWLNYLVHLRLFLEWSRYLNWSEISEWFSFLRFSKLKQHFLLKVTFLISRSDGLNYLTLCTACKCSSFSSYWSLIYQIIRSSSWIGQSSCLPIKNLFTYFF